MWNIQANIYLDEEAKQKDPVIGDLLEKVMNKCVQFYVLYVSSIIFSANCMHY